MSKAAGTRRRYPPALSKPRNAVSRRKLHHRRLLCEPLEDRRLLSVFTVANLNKGVSNLATIEVEPPPATTTVGIGAPVLVAFDDPTATAGTTFSATSDNADVQATVLRTTLLRMQVHTVNSDGSVGTQGEMDFLLLDDYAPNNIAHIEALANAGFYNGVTFHRILQDFVIQGGDPTGTGSGGSGPNGAAGAVQDDEFNVDIRYTTNGLLAIANSGTDTNDCQFFITADQSRFLDYQYPILGKLVAGDDIRQAIADVPVEQSYWGEMSKPVNPPIIDSVTIDTTSNEYGLLLLKAGSAATAGEEGAVAVVASDGGTVSLTDTDGTAGHPLLEVALTTDTPSPQDRPAFVDQTMPDVHTTMNTPVTFPIPVEEGDAGVPLTYGAAVASNTSDLTCNSASDGSANATATPSGDILGVYDLIVGVWRSGTDPNSHTGIDRQHVALFVQPLAPTALSFTDPDFQPGLPIDINNGLTFHVDGVTPGLTVSIFADGNTTPIGSAVASGTTVDIVTTVPLPDGQHTFVAKQSYDYGDTVVGNRTIPAGDLYSDPSPSFGVLTIDTPPTAVALLGDVERSDIGITFVVTYSNPGDTVLSSTIDDSDIRVTNVNGFDQLARFVIAVSSGDGATVTVTYAFDAPGGVWDANSLVKYTLTMQQDQVSDSHSNYVVPGALLSFNPGDLAAPTVTVNQATGQTDPTEGTSVNFTVTFSEAVADFFTGDVTIGGTAGATWATVTQVGTDGTTYNVAVSGMTCDGTVIVSLAAGVAHDAVGNPSEASTSTDNSVTIWGTPTDISLSTSSVAENMPVGTTVGTLGTTDPNSSDTFTYTLVIPLPCLSGTDASCFTIEGNTLKTNATFDYESGKTSYQILIRSTGPGGLSMEKPFTINVTDVKDPVFSSVVVAEAAAPKNRVIESNDPLKITWAVSSPNGAIVSQAVQIDGGATISKGIGGPYGKSYYSCPIGTETAGTHSYTITAKDAKGVTSSISGTLVVVAPVLPTIAGVVVAEAAAPRNGTLENNEKLKMTCAVSSSNGIAAESVTVDGKAITSLYGPYGVNYSCPIGICSAGTHQYVISATDLKGATFNYRGTFTVAAAAVTPPVISSAVVAEAAAPKNRIIESSDPLKITWAASKDAASESVTVDGRRITAISGPYGKLYYSCAIGAWSAGTHAYSITATNAGGLSSTYSGTFGVTAASPMPLTIGSVVVAEAAAPRDGVLDPTEMLVISWAAASSAGKITSQAITIDGRSISPIRGPYGQYYSCPIGAWSAGTHTYTITATSNSPGSTYSYSGTFTVAARRANLLAAVMEENNDAHSDSLGLLAVVSLGGKRLLGGPSAASMLPDGPADKTDALDLVFATMADGKRE